MLGLHRARRWRAGPWTGRRRRAARRGGPARPRSRRSPQPSSIVSSPSTSGERADLGLGDAPHAPARVRVRPVDAWPSRPTGPPSSSQQLAVDVLVAHAASALPCGVAGGQHLRARARGPSGSRPSPRRRGRRGRSCAPSRRAPAAPASPPRPPSARTSAARGHGRWGATRSGSGTAPRCRGAPGRRRGWSGSSTPPSTYSRSPICTGAKIPAPSTTRARPGRRVAGCVRGTEDDAAPLRRSTATIRSRPSKRAPSASISRPRPGIERFVRGTAFERRRPGRPRRRGWRWPARAGRAEPRRRR